MAIAAARQSVNLEAYARDRDFTARLEQDFARDLAESRAISY